MRPYEVMVIFDTGVEPSAIQAVLDRALDTVRTTGGTAGAVDRWGRRSFAYEVQHKREGYYVLVDFAGEVQTVNSLDRLLSLADEVLRHKIIRLPEKAVKRSGAAVPPVDGVLAGTPAAENAAG
jgi:small subunit ribosomal protein S6